MRQLYFLAGLLGVFLSVTGSAQQRCASYEILQQQMAADPLFAKKVRESEKSFVNYNRPTGEKGRPITVIIPVVVHVVYNTAEQNISDGQVQSQIDVMNEDYTATNRDYNNYNAGYGAVKGDADIKFCLVQIIHKTTFHTSFPVNDAMKFTRRGGSDAVNPMHVMNIWVCNLGQNILGYAQFPGGSAETFGVVCHYKAFGRGAQYNLFTAYNLGRTMTHEIGHCFGLRHIWGDANCGNDFVDDTPLHNAANFGCPGEGHRSTCTGTPLEMWMNYMDYTDDRCMYFLSNGQVSRMNFFIGSDAQLQSIFNSSCTQPANSNPVTNNGKTINSNRTGNDFIIYPTITSGRINLQINTSSTWKNEIAIYNETGVLIMKQSITVAPGLNKKELDLSRLGNGVYIIQLGSNAESKMKKLIIEH